MRIEDRDGSTQCVYGGAVTVEELNPKADYLMFADTQRWQEMGAGKYGPMKAMMFGRLKFKGPKGEAMNNMGPFGNFLVLTGQVPSNADVCPWGLSARSYLRVFFGGLGALHRRFP